MQKNRKKMLAVFAVGLMIVFILPQVAFDQTRGTSREVMGRVGGEKVSAGELRNAQDQWRALVESSLLDVHPELRIVASILGPDLEQHPELFFLLQHEARQLGMNPPTEGVDELLRSLMQFRASMGQSMPNVQLLRPAVSNAMLVSMLFNRVAGSIKPSGPSVQRELADNDQFVKLDLVHYAADDFKAAVPAPSAEDLQRQFDQFKNTPPAATPQNPFGFGYLIPAQVKLQYLTVPREEVTRALRKSKPEFDWRYNALMRFREDPSRYPSATQPSTQPASQPASQPATAPTTAAATTKPTAEGIEMIVQDMLRTEVDTKIDAISTALRERMAKDYQAVLKQAAGAPADFGSRAYLDRVAVDVEKHHGIKLGIAEINDAKTRETLREIKGIGESRLVDNRPFADFVMERAEPLLSQAQTRASGIADEVLSLDEPSPRLRDSAGNVYVFQVKDAQPAHPPADVAAVKEKVEADIRTRLAFESAAAAARKFESGLGAASFEDAAKAAQKDLFSTPDFFDRQGNTELQTPATLIPAVDLPQPARNQLADEAYKLLAKATPDKAHPSAVIELPSTGRVVVAQLSDVQRAWTDDFQSLSEFRASQMIVSRHASRIVRDYFRYDNVKQRLDYHPANEEQTQTAAAE